MRVKPFDSSLLRNSLDSTINPSAVHWIPNGIHPPIIRRRCQGIPEHLVAAQRTHRDVSKIHITFLPTLSINQYPPPPEIDMSHPERGDFAPTTRGIEENPKHGLVPDRVEMPPRRLVERWVRHRQKLPEILLRNGRDNLFCDPWNRNVPERIDQDVILPQAPVKEGRNPPVASPVIRVTDGSTVDIQRGTRFQNTRGTPPYDPGQVPPENQPSPPVPHTPQFPQESAGNSLWNRECGSKFPSPQGSSDAIR